MDAAEEYAKKNTPLFTDKDVIIKAFKEGAKYEQNCLNPVIQKRSQYIDELQHRLHTEAHSKILEGSELCKAKSILAINTILPGIFCDFCPMDGCDNPGSIEKCGLLQDFMGCVTRNLIYKGIKPILI